MSWPEVKLEDLVDVNPPAVFVDENIVSFIPMQSVSDTEKRIVELQTRPLVEVAKGYTQFKNGDLLLAKITPCFENGKQAIVEMPTSVGYGSTEFHVFRKKDDQIDIRFLHYFFQQPSFRHAAAINMTGTAGQKRVPAGFLARLKIPLPPLEVQKKIAAVLEKADTLRRKREEQIKRLDDLLQATFLDMFGDPVTNPKGWPVKVLENIVSNDCSVSYGIVQPGDFVEDGIPVVRPVDLDNGVIQVSALKKIAPDIAGKYPRSFLKGNELLLTVRGSIGAVYLTSNEFAGSNVTRGIVPLRFNERIANKEFVYCMFQTESFKGYFKKISKGATLVQLNINELRKVPIILPAMEYQKAFKDIFLSLTSNKSRLEEASKKMDNTFNSLMQRAFKGELELK